MRKKKCIICKEKAFGRYFNLCIDHRYLEGYIFFDKGKEYLSETGLKKLKEKEHGLQSSI